jgi:phage FluMu gp28-like protein
LFSERDKLREDVNVIEQQRLSKAETLKADPLEFFRQVLGVEPTDYQKELIELFQKNQFVAARWCRQAGKSFTVSGMLLNYALANSNVYIGVVGPSLRQTKLIIRRIGCFANKLAPSPKIIVQRTRITCANGSVIEAFPNNPDTIRGPTLHVVYADEFNFIPNAEDLYDAILFTLGTTNGKFICTSTPWNSDSLFWKICNHDDFSDFARHHVTWERAKEPNGTLKLGILEKIRRQLLNDPARWRREMEAEWAEDEDVWLTQSLIVSCIDSELVPYEFEAQPAYGEFFVGVDLGQKQDYSVVVVMEKQGHLLRVIHVHRFPLRTEYASVIGYVKSLQDRWRVIRSVYVDYTGVGVGIVEDMVKSGIQGVTGITFTVNSKEDMANILRERMRQGEVKISYVPVRKSGDIDLTVELNVERYMLMKTGHVGFSHPEGTHDDVFWALALSCYGAVQAPMPGRGAVMAD